MKIYYKQPKPSSISFGLRSIGVKDCYFKMLLSENSRKKVTRKQHYHTDFELHLITEGHQIYDVAGVRQKLKSGHFLLIYPNVPHRIIDVSSNIQKFAITFHLEATNPQNSFFGHITERIQDNFTFIKKEAGMKKEFSSLLIENCILEILVTIFRMVGMPEKSLYEREDGNVTLTLAKQYIQDNIEFAPTVDEVAKYCYLSRKHLTRIFKEAEDKTPGEYIRIQRSLHIERMLSDSTLSLSEISDRMHFSSEYYFNTFFKKYSGMPPGEYRSRVTTIY